MNEATPLSNLSTIFRSLSNKQQTNFFTHSFDSLTVRSKILVRLRNLVIFGDFRNDFRPTNLNFHNCPINRARRASRQGNFVPENYSENLQK